MIVKAKGFPSLDSWNVMQLSVKKLDGLSIFNPKSGITRDLARNVVRLEYGDIPSDVVCIAKTAFLDATGCMLTGALQESSRKVLRYARGLGGSPDATCVYYGDRTNIYNAALVNGTFCHNSEFDHVFRLGVNCESVLIPAVIAAAEKRIANGHEVITSLVAGWEVMNRLAAAASIIPLKRSLDPISTFGPFGAAAAGGKISRFNDFDMENALTCCPAQAAGTLQFTQTNCESGRLTSGFAASYGLRAANMAREGISGARDILEGRSGFFMCIAGLRDDGTPKFNVDKVNDSYGRKWYMRDFLSETSGEGNERFRERATLAGISGTRQDRVIEIVNNLEEQDDMIHLMSNLTISKGVGRLG